MLAVMRRPTPHNDPSFMDDSLLDTVFRVSYWMNVSLVHRANTCTELSHYRWIGAVFYRCCGISHSQFIGPSTGSFIAGRPRYTLCPRGSHSLLSRHRPAPDVNTGMLVLTWLRVRGLLRPGVPPAGGQISAGLNRWQLARSRVAVTCCPTPAPRRPHTRSPGHSTPARGQDGRAVTHSLGLLFFLGGEPPWAAGCGVAGRSGSAARTLGFWPGG